MSAEHASAAKRAVLLSSCALLRGRLCHSIAFVLAQATSDARGSPCFSLFCLLRNLLALLLMAVAWAGGPFWCCLGAGSIHLPKMPLLVLHVRRQ